jgi:phosphatidylinositol glycan class V
VGFLRYWNLPNLPLFLMAAPMIWLLSSTSIAVLRGPATSSTPGRPGNSPSRANTASAELGLLDLPQIALPQLALTAAALTSFHVQIINRLSSGYPIWYLVVATWITAQGPASAGGKEDSLPQWIVRGIIMYAVVQGLLFAAFLPPA